jgi:hypothetical protein
MFKHHPFIHLSLIMTSMGGNDVALIRKRILFI